MSSDKVQVDETKTTQTSGEKKEFKFNPNATEFKFNANAEEFVFNPTPVVKKVENIENVEKQIETKKVEEPNNETKKDEEPKVEKKRELRVAQKDHLNIVFIGHVDAGKSTLGGQILIKHGQVDERTIEKYTKEAKDKNRDSWFLAYILDCSEEEKEKGKTVQVARASFSTSKKRYTILDAPGHSNYVPNMIGGTSQADVAVLVISARTDEFEKGFERDGQTREHTTLAKTLGVRKVIVVVNKMDVKSVQWSEKRFNEIVKKLTPFFTKVGFNKKSVYFVPISAYKGINIDKKVDSSICGWYKGLSLVGQLDNLKLKNKRSNDPLRIPIIDRFKSRGGVAILGKIESGTVKVGDKILMQPSNQEVEVIKLQLHDMEVDIAKSGENCEVHVKGVEEADVYAGFVLSEKDRPCFVVQEFVGEMLVLEHKSIFAAGYSTMLHAYTNVMGVTVTSLMSKTNVKTGKKEDKKPKVAMSGELITAKFKLDEPICLEKYSTLPKMGRFTLREDKTVAIGKVTAIKPFKNNN